MNAQQIEHVMKNNPFTSNFYIGCFTENKLTLLSEPGIYIINTVNDYRKMGHWILFISSYNTVIYFDSYGFQPLLYSQNIDNFLNKFKNKIMLNSSPLQSKSSLLCGCYCIYIAERIAMKKSINLIFKVFKNKTNKENDSFIKIYFYRMLGKSKKYPFICPMLTFRESCRISPCVMVRKS